MIQIQIKDTQIKDLLSKLAARANNMQPGMQSIGETIRTSIERNFAQEGRPEKWKKSLRAKEESGQTLSDTARLRRSFTVAAKKDSVIVGTNVIYAALHHFGAKKGRFGTVQANVREHVRHIAKAGKTSTVRAHKRKMKLPRGDIPARPFIMVQNEDWTEIRAMLEDYMTGAKR